MLRAVPMMFLRVQVARRDASAVTRCIARAGVLHLVDLAEGKTGGLQASADLAELLASFRELERRLRRTAERLGLGLAAAHGHLDAHTDDPAPELAALEGRFRDVERDVDAAWRALLEAREAGTRLDERLASARLLEETGLPLERVARLRFLRVTLARGTEEAAERAAELLAPAPHALIPLCRDEPRWVYAAAAPASLVQRTEQLLQLAGCEPVPLPADAAALAPATLAREREAAEAARAQAEARLAGLREAHRGLVTELLGRAQLMLLLLQAQRHFAQAGHFVVVSGWVPAAQAELVRASLQEACGGHAVVELERPEAMGAVRGDLLRVPILHRNPLLLRPFQRLISVYGTPSYREVEPTAFFAVSFLLMFGLMFGDVGHGLVLFATGWFAFRHLPRFLDYGLLLMEGGAVSVLFGFLYGSIFGVESLLPALWLRPLHDLQRFMTVATGVGVVLLSVGLALGAVNAWRSGQRLQALFGMRGLLGAFLYWTALVLVARAFLPSDTRVPAWLLWALVGVAGALLLARPVVVRWLRPRRARPHGVATGPRWLHALEAGIDLVDTVFSFFTHTLSFVRIAAFAAVHAGICVALFALADTLSRLPLGSVWSALTLVLGNVLVILLEGLTVSVQTLRLEYYEFFSRFFRGGGEPYQPFSLNPSVTSLEGASHAADELDAREGGPRGLRPPPVAGAGGGLHPRPR